MGRDSRRRTVLVALAICAGLVPAIALGRSSGNGHAVFLRGTLLIGHYDDLPTDRVRHFAMLVTSTQQVALDFAGDVPERLSGRRVLVRGMRHQGRLDVAAVRALAPPPSERASRALSGSATTTSLRVAVILFNFTNDQSQPWSPETARGLVLTNPDSAAAYYREVTYGKVSLVGDVYGWLTIPYSNMECSFAAWGTAAKDAVARTGVDLSGYDKFVLAFPKASSCQWSGVGGGADAWLNGAMMLRIAAHELGHTLGLGHSKSMSCTSDGLRVSIGADVAGCTVDEYGDIFDVMGASGSRHVSNVGRAALSWLDPDRVATVTTSGTYVLAPAEPGAASASQLLRVARTDGSWLNLEFRQPFGEYFDNFPSADPVVNGVSIRWTPPNAMTPRLLDATPDTLTFDDAPLAVGQTFTDPAGGLTIRTVEISASGATVEIEVVPNLTDVTAPTAPSNLTGSVAKGRKVTLTWSPATDNVGVAAYRVVRDGVSVASVGGTSYTESLAAKRATYVVVAVDAAGNASSPSNSVTLR